MSTSQLRTSSAPKQDNYPIRARRFALLSGVIYDRYLDGCLLGLPSFGTCFMTVPQHLITLDVPEEYLSSTQAP
jgi:hypothetical protein